ncbi:hypothetical protein [Mycobacteroides abscessus]|uniref:hypothetical protein n=1 Tax=Mycobacteroides abscessus TaxID=36809 RepID=UPI0010543F9E|nr:hypothetical protein [Mycobacteroides abscessus]
MQLLSQKDLDCAGLMTLHVAMWAKGCDEITDTDLSADLLVLEDSRFVFVDEETDELFVRGYMRSAQVIKSPNIFKSALKSAGMVESPKLKVEVAAELRRLRRAEATKLADLLDPEPAPPDGMKGSETLSEESKGSQTLPEPSRSVSVSVSGSVGSGELWVGAPPSMFCSKHPNGTNRACLPCQHSREQFERWESDEQVWQKAALAAAAERRRNCKRCDGSGWINLPDDSGVVDCECKHPGTLQLVHDATSIGRAAG